MRPRSLGLQICHGNPLRDRSRAFGRIAGLRATALACFLVVGAVLAAPSDAQRPPEELTEEERRAEAVRLFELGNLHYQGNEYDDAARAYLRAFEYEPNATLAINAALAFENDGDLDAARAWFERALTAEPDAEERDTAERGLRRVDSILSRIEEQRAPPRLHVETTPEGAAILVDGEEIGTTPYEADIAAGGHELVLVMDGYREHREQILAEPGSVVRLVVPLVAEQLSSGSSGSGSAGGSEPERSGISRIPGFSLAGVAAAGLGVGIGFGLRASSIADDLESDAELLRDDAAFDAAKSEGETARIVSIAGYAVGLTAFAGSAVLLLLSRSPSDDVVSATRGFHVWGDGLGVTWERRF